MAKRKFTQGLKKRGKGPARPGQAVYDVPVPKGAKMLATKRRTK